MNYLGHLYFSNNDKKLMLNNLYGDFVKGKDLTSYPKQVQDGIHLHRQIDDFIDHFPEVIELQHTLQQELPKVASVATDLFFDHLLAKNWKKYHKKNLNLFLNEFYSSIEIEQDYYNDKFKFMISKMIEMNWISHYPKLEGLEKLCRGVSSRLSFDNKLKDGKEVFLKHETLVNQVFTLYMERAIEKFGIAIPK